MRSFSAYLFLVLLLVLPSVMWLPTPGVVLAAPVPAPATPGACQLAEPFVGFAEALGPWTVGECVANPATDADGTLHQETGQGTLSLFPGAERPVFREATRLWIDGPGGMAADVHVVIPASQYGDRLDVRRRASLALERGALDESTMPMGWEALGPPSGRTFPGAACQPSSDDLVLGRVQALFGDERGEVRVLQGVGALRDGAGPEMFERVRGWLATCPEWKATFPDHEITYRMAVRPLETLGEESVRYRIEAIRADAPAPNFTDTVLVRYGDLIVSHTFLLTAPDQVKDGDLVGISQLAERKLRAGLR